MNELKAKSEITYSISGLTFTDMELLCLGLENMDDCEFEMVDRKAEIITLIDDLLNK